MTIDQYIIDAFTDRVFEGNPAAICVLEQWPKDTLMQKIAIENRLSETAFLVPEKTGLLYKLRWFTPGGEIDLCGHATLAAAWVLFRFDHPDWDLISFETRSGLLTVRRRKDLSDLLEMDFPAYHLTPVPVTDTIEQALGIRPIEAWLGRDLLCVLDSAESVIALRPDLEKVRELDGLLLHVTASGNQNYQNQEQQYDCISRSFGPKLQVPEDPVCGSGHCHIIPYWASKWHKSELIARQASLRGGTLYGRMDQTDRVILAGHAALYAKSKLYL